MSKAGNMGGKSFSEFYVLKTSRRFRPPIFPAHDFEDNDSSTHGDRLPSTWELIVKGECSGLVC